MWPSLQGSWHIAALKRIMIFNSVASNCPQAFSLKNVQILQVLANKFILLAYEFTLLANKFISLVIEFSALA